MIVSSESCEIWPVTLWYYSILQIWEQLWPTKVFAVFDLDQPFDISSNSMTSPAIGKSLRRGSVVAIFLRHRCCVSWHVFGIQLWSYCRLVSLWASWIGKKTGIHLWMGDGWKVEILDEELQSFTQEATAITQVLHVFLLVFQSLKCSPQVSSQVSYPFLSCYIWFCQTSCKHLEYWNSWDLCHVQSYREKNEFDKPWQAWNSFWTSRGSLFETFGLHRRRFLGMLCFGCGAFHLPTLWDWELWGGEPGMRVWENVPEIFS